MSKEAIKTGELTRGKAALIAVLLIAIVGVMWSQFGSSPKKATARSEDVKNASRQPKSKAGTARRNRRLKPSTPPANASDQQATPVAWPTIDIANTEIHDPFELAAGIRAMMPAEEEPALVVETVPSAEEESDEEKQKADELLAKQIEKQEKARLEREKARLAAVAKRKAEISSLVKNGVAAIIQLGDERVALIGEREVKVGDSLNGMRVVAIHDKGVELEEVEPTTTPTPPELDADDSDNSGANGDN